MKKLLHILSISLVILGAAFTSVSAETSNQILVQEAITSYVSNITVNTDNSIDVVETISYNSGSQDKHGIFRDINPISSTGEKMSIEDISVRDELGNPYTFKVLSTKANIQIIIGDADETFTGQKVYVIKYRATNAVAQLDEVDEIYWNVTGVKWPMPIYEAKAYVTLPPQASTTQSSCYFGPQGSDSACLVAVEDGDVYTFSVPNQLNSYEGFTVALGFQKGVVDTYPLEEKSFFELYLNWIIGLCLPLITLGLSLRHWRAKGRDPEGTGVIIPQYDVPDNLTPMEVGGIVDEKVTASQISAEIIHLATKGYIKINQLEETTFGFIKTKDYELISLKSFADLPNEFDQIILKGLFGKKKTPVVDFASVFNIRKTEVEPETIATEEYLSSVKLSNLKDSFYKTVTTVISSVLANLLSKGYYKNLGRMKGPGSDNGIFIVLFLAIWAAALFGTVIGVFLLENNPVPVIIGIFTTVIIYGVMSYLSPAKTVRGVELKEYLLGLKNYLQIAEKDRLQFHNAPDKKPEVFEKLLPFAMVLGVSGIWAKEFEGMYSTPPDWYSGPVGANFSATSFNKDMSSFSTFAATSLTSSPSSSGGGSGGGGFSGGGGGGGGGGSW